MKSLAAVSAFVGKTFAVWVILFAVLGFYFPDTFKQIGPWIVTLLSIIMFGMGLTLSVDDFREVVKRPVDVTIGVLGQFLIMPLLAVLLTRIIPMPPEVAAGVILVGCCPGGTSSNVMTYLSKGDVALSVACTSVTTLAAPLVTPFLVWLFASQFLPVDGWAMFLSIVKVVLVPLALGAALQKLAFAKCRQGGRAGFAARERHRYRFDRLGGCRRIEGRDRAVRPDDLCGRGSS